MAPPSTRPLSKKEPRAEEEAYLKHLAATKARYAKYGMSLPVSAKDGDKSGVQATIKTWFTHDSVKKGTTKP